MQILRRKMGESRWKTIRAVRYRHKMTVFDGVPAAAGLVTLSADAPFFVERGGKKQKIIDEGYLWLQLAPEDGFWWLTAMYDEKGKLVQFYFDVTSGNRIRPDGESEYDDLFVDVVVTPGKPPRIVDEDELSQAAACGVITQAQAERAMETAREICEKYADTEALEAFCAARLKELME